MQFLVNVIELFDRDSVRYVLVGGLATVLHGHVRLTADVDVVLDLEDGNVRKALAVMDQLGFQPRVPALLFDFAEPAKRKFWKDEKGLVVFSVVHPSDPFSLIDFFVEEPMPFDTLFAGSTLMSLGTYQIRVVSLEHLIALKKAAGRPKDLDDVEVLEELKSAHERQ
jgi:hypothetical protein